MDSAPFRDISALSAHIAGWVAAAAPRIVSVQARGGGWSSGFVWQSGLIVAAQEALSGADKVTVGFDGGFEAEAEVAGRDASTGVALLKGQTPTLESWAAAPVPQAGSLVLALGRGGESPIASFGLVSEVGGSWHSMRGGLIDARIRLGLRLSSRAEGGAVVAPDGTLIGLALLGPRGRALAIPASTVARAVQTLREKGYVPRGYLGVSLHPASEGVLVTAVEPQSPAGAAGLLMGDLITKWNDREIRSVPALFNALTGAAGTRAKLGLVRGGNPLDIEIDIGERPRQ